MADLREKVGKAIAKRRAIRMVDANGGDSTRIKAWNVDARDRQDADAAIAAVLDALEEPSEGMRGAWASSGKHDDWRKECDIGWQAMLTAFRAEALMEGK